MNVPDPVDEVQRQLDRELRLVADAVAMVAAGASPRITVAGLRLGDAVLDPARSLAEEAGVRIVPQWTGDESGVDIAVERIPE